MRAMTCPVGPGGAGVSVGSPRIFSPDSDGSRTLEARLGIPARPRSATPFSAPIVQIGWFVFYPDEMRPAMQAQGVEIHDAADAAERQALLMLVAADILARMHGPSLAGPYGAVF